MDRLSYYAIYRKYIHTYTYIGSNKSTLKYLNKGVSPFLHLGSGRSKLGVRGVQINLDQGSQAENSRDAHLFCCLKNALNVAAHYPYLTVKKDTEKRYVIFKYRIRKYFIKYWNFVQSIT